MAAHRARVRQDPVAYNEYLQKERERNKCRKEAAKELKFKSVQQLTDRELRARRKQGREWSHNYRTRSKGNYPVLNTQQL